MTFASSQLLMIFYSKWNETAYTVPGILRVLSTPLDLCALHTVGVTRVLHVKHSTDKQITLTGRAKDTLACVSLKQWGDKIKLKMWRRSNFPTAGERFSVLTNHKRVDFLGDLIWNESALSCKPDDRWLSETWSSFSSRKKKKKKRLINIHKMLHTIRYSPPNSRWTSLLAWKTKVPGTGFDRHYPSAQRLWKHTAQKCKTALVQLLLHMLLNTSPLKVINPVRLLNLNCPADIWLTSFPNYSKCMDSSETTGEMSTPLYVE